MASKNNNNRIAVVFFAGAVLFALIAIWGIFTLLSGYKTLEVAQNRPVDTVTVVTASRTLYQGVGITGDDLFVLDIAPDYLPRIKDLKTNEERKAPTFASRERVVGQVPRERILANEIIRPERLADGNAGIGLNAVIPRGMRALSVNLRGADAVDGFLEPGNYVDVLVTMKDELQRPRTETILQAVFVLGVNSRAQNEEAEDVSTRGRQAPSVTFLVTPKQAEEIAFADEMGQISLTLRNVQDVVYTPLTGASLDTLLTRLRPRAEPLIPEEPRPTRVRVNSGTNQYVAPVQQDDGARILIIRGKNASEVRAEGN